MKGIDFRITGPVRLLQACLIAGCEDLFKSDGKLSAKSSPLSPLSLEERDLEAMGVPPNARYYSFMYPLDELMERVDPNAKDEDLHAERRFEKLPLEYAAITRIRILS